MFAGHPRASVILSLALLGLAAPGLLAVASWVRAYVKKPMETPSVLVSISLEAWSLLPPTPPAPGLEEERPAHPGRPQRLLSSREESGLFAPSVCVLRPTNSVLEELWGLLLLLDGCC